MRRSLAFPVLLLAASCSQPAQERRSSEDLQSYEVSEDASAPAPNAPPPPVTTMSRSADRSGGPDVSPTAAPGVAFNYRYSFRLPAERIAQIQEQHAQACEQLGVSRCRITGMRYRVVNESDIEAMLAFKLEPSLARRFGRAGVEAVTRAEGMLTESEISGTDVGTSIRAAGRNLAEMEADLRRLEAQLARRNLPSEERARIEYEAQQLRQSIRATRANREDQAESLATTPMVFQYGSGDLVPGFDTRSPFRDALRTAGDNLVGGAALMLILVVTLLPWALIALLVWWAFRKLRARFGTPRAEPEV